jgi:hypothetical protein
MMSCGMRRVVLSAASLHLMGWTIPIGAAHAHHHGYLGSGAPQLVPERLVSTWRCHLGQVQAICHEADQLD